LKASLITIALPGAVGGLLCSLKARALNLPRWSVLRGTAIDPGLFADIWLGAAGGYAVFLIVPGDLAFAPGAGPPASQPADPGFWAWIEITSLALLGGFAARAAAGSGRGARVWAAGGNGERSATASGDRAVHAARPEPAAEERQAAASGQSAWPNPGPEVYSASRPKTMAAADVMPGGGSEAMPPLEFSRALSNIRLDPSFTARPPAPSMPTIREAILADLRVCARDPFAASLVREEPIVQDWLRLNHERPV
jgi:hypothetical protein